MGSLVLKSGIKIKFTTEQLEEIKRLQEMTDEDIDCSGIPALTDEKLAKFKTARLRRQKQNIAN